jgi:alpha-tubulin suppressor-like RCC1 family protein
VRVRSSSLPGLAACAAGALLTGCGASHSHSSSPSGSRAPARQPIRARHGAGHATRTLAASRSSIVYQWGQFGGGGARIGLGRPGAHRGSPNGVGPVRWLPTVVRGLPGTIVQVATSNSDSYALTAGGEVYAWGAGSQGELGDGTRRRLSVRAVRVHLPAGVRVRALSNPMPYDGGMAIATSGTAWAWGNDRSREFCQPRGRILRTPIPVPLQDVALAVGALRHAIYDSAGRMVSCGAGAVGQLGDGTSGPTARTGAPVAVQGLPPGSAVALTSGWGNAGVLMADGRYYDWGYNRGGQVGDGTRSMATTAVQVALPRAVRQVFQGGSYGDNGQTIALLSGGAAWEWGNGRFGQLGDGTRRSSLWAIRLDALRGLHLVAVASGGSTTYAVDRAGALWAWGNNQVAQLGDGSITRVQLTPVPDPVRVSQISSTAHNVAALAAPGG